MAARPLESGLGEAIDDGRVGPRDQPKARSKVLSEKELAKKIWCFGPGTADPNMVVDMCKGAQYLNEIRDSIVAGFEWASKQRALTEDNMRGMSSVMLSSMQMPSIEVGRPFQLLGGLYMLLSSLQN